MDSAIIYVAQFFGAMLLRPARYGWGMALDFYRGSGWWALRCALLRSRCWVAWESAGFAA